MLNFSRSKAQSCVDSYNKKPRPKLTKATNKVILLKRPLLELVKKGQTSVRRIVTRDLFESRSGLAVSVSSYETTGPGSILGVAIFPG